jgi:membrane protease YdiL (CAAX protease family)
METSALDNALLENAGAITAFYSVVVLVGLLIDAALLGRLRAQPVNWRQHLNRLYWRPCGDREALLLVGVLAAMFAALAFSVKPLEHLFRRAGVDGDSALIFIQSVTFHWTGLGLVVAWLAVKRIPWSSAFGMRLIELPRRSLQALTYLLATMPVLVFYTVLYGILLEASGHAPTQQDVAYAISGTTSPLARFYFFFLAVGLAPLVEEILFRGVVLVALAKRLGAGAAVVIVSIFFATMHGHVPSMVPLFILSVGLSLAYIFSESLLVPIVMHSLFNLVSVSWLFQAV